MTGCILVMTHECVFQHPSGPFQQIEDNSHSFRENVLGKDRDTHQLQSPNLPSGRGEIVKGLKCKLSWSSRSSPTDKGEKGKMNNFKTFSVWYMEQNHTPAHGLLVPYPELYWECKVVWCAYFSRLRSRSAWWPWQCFQCTLLPVASWCSSRKWALLMPAIKPIYPVSFQSIVDTHKKTPSWL